MIWVRGTNIISPLGTTARDNFAAVRGGKTALELHDGLWGVPEPFVASLLERPMWPEADPRYTIFEHYCIQSARIALADCGIYPASQDTLFVLSTTKGNVSELHSDPMSARAYLGSSATRIKQYFKNPNVPLTVSNACVSGVCAQMTAARALLSGRYRHAVVIGCDLLSPFIVSGFQSFKALSPTKCRPFDKNRNGLNLGEAAATMILSVEPDPDSRWTYAASSNHNDANHISGPSRTGEGAYRVLDDILRKVDVSQLAFVNVHGTATPYNDEMESIALNRAHLQDTPVNALKGYYGHTLGAAGILETILSMCAVDNGIVPATKGYHQSGTTQPVNVADHERTTDKNAFVKILSGFGGSNAGIAYIKQRHAP